MYKRQDFPLECQGALLGALEAGKRIGITLTDSLLMAPVKSVTAVIGMSRIRRDCTVKGCEVCEKTDCAYRRNETARDSNLENDLGNNSGNGKRG